jgi:hypothetical protein
LFACKAARVTNGLPPNLRESLRSFSEESCFQASQLVESALLHLLKEFKNGGVDLGGDMNTSRDPRYDWNLDPPNHPFKNKGKAKSLKLLK